MRKRAKPKEVRTVSESAAGVKRVARKQILTFLAVCGLGFGLGAIISQNRILSIALGIAALYATVVFCREIYHELMDRH